MKPEIGVRCKRPAAVSKSGSPFVIILNERIRSPGRGRLLVHYSLLFYLSPEGFAARADARNGEAFWAAFVPYLKALRDAGVLVARAGLQPPRSATTLRQQGDKHLVQDGPYAETKEQLGGFFVIDVPNLDTALEWAARYPAKVVEVRPTSRLSSDGMGHPRKSTKRLSSGGS